MSSARSDYLPSITPKTWANCESPSPGPDDLRLLLKRNETEFCRYSLLDSLTMGLTLLMNMICAFVYYCRNIQNRRVAWLNYLADTYTYGSATMILLAGCYSNPPRTGPVKNFLSDVICCLRKLQREI
jgi:hypothetical protein